MAFPLEIRKRYTFLGLALLLHIVVFLALCRFVVFIPTPVDNTEFQQVALPKVEPPPAPPQTIMVKVPQMAQAAPAAPNITPPAFNIITSTKANFPMPHVDQSTLNGYGQHLASIANGNANGNATSDTSVMGSALASDGRPGEIMGIFSINYHPYSEAAPMDDIRRRALDMIGWFIEAPGYGPPHFAHGKDVPILTGHPDGFQQQPDPLDGELKDISNSLQTVYNLDHDIFVKTIVLVDNFDVTPATDAGHSADHDGASKQIARELGYKHIRLCIISFKNPPYPPLMEYVKESGGTVLYPNGIPAAVTTAQLKASANAP